MLLFDVHCRHSDRFYGSMITPISPPADAGTDAPPDTILDIVIKLCVDEDPATRKFACFAGRAEVVGEVCILWMPLHRCT